MLQPNIDSAPYSELDFPRFNPQGFVRVTQAVECAQQARALARTPEEMREATAALRAAADIKSAEQQVARANFEAERREAFDALSGACERAGRARLSPARRLEVENRLDYLVTLFNMKEFAAVLRESTAVPVMTGEIREQTALRTPERRRRHALPAPTLSELFEHGRSLELDGRTREAVEVYGRIIARHPNHSQAIGRLKQIGSRQSGGTGNRRALCKVSYTRRGR